MQKPARVKAACDNCGYVAIYEMPFRARFVSFSDDDAINKSSLFKPTFPYPPEPVNCDNCGLPKLEVIYWDSTGKSPLTRIDKVHEHYPPEED